MKEKGSVYTLWSAAIVLCLLASVFALFFASCAHDTGAGLAVEREEVPPPATAALGAAPETEETPVETPEITVPTRLGETADAGRAYLDKLIFLGDSTTYGIGYYYEHGYSDELCPPSQVWTPASGTLTLSYYDTATIVYPETGEELSIVDAVTRAKPDIMLLTLGVNGVSFMDEEWFVRAYTELVQNIQKASPDTKIILNSIYPVMSTYQYIDQISNERINAANGWIEQIAANTGTRFLYSYESVVGEDGTLPAENCNGDGIHLSGEGFTKVMQYVRTHEYR